MAVYKVAQDVEADDKLIGPFSFRQFIYLIVVAIAGGLAWGLSQVAIPLAIFPLPIILFFGALALPLKKDQPMETYLAAIVSFHLKPKKRLWIPDGVESLIEITAPKVVEDKRTKDFTHDEAEKRLSYLADIVDTRGWAVRGAALPPTNNAMINDVYFDAQQVPDLLDDGGGLAQSFSSMIDQTDARHKQELVDRIQHPEQAIAAQPQEHAVAADTSPAPTPASESLTAPSDSSQTLIPQSPPVQPSTPLSPPLSPPPAANQQAQSQEFTPVFNPYPSMHQSVVQPPDHNDALTITPPNPQNTSEIHVSPDIINLVSNNSLSVETMAKEANRINSKKKLDDSDEVVISLH